MESQEEYLRFACRVLDNHARLNDSSSKAQLLARACQKRASVIQSPMVVVRPSVLAEDLVGGPPGAIRGGSKTQLFGERKQDEPQGAIANLPTIAR